MNLIIKNTVLVFALFFTALVNANNPLTDNLEEVEPQMEILKNSIEKVNAKEVKHVFRKVKRVDRILTPKKRLYKVKYTIA